MSSKLTLIARLSELGVNRRLEPFELGDADQLRSLIEEAGASMASIDTQRGTARFPSVRTWSNPICGAGCP